MAIWRRSRLLTHMWSGHESYEVVYEMDAIFWCFHGNLVWKRTNDLHVVGSGRVHGCHFGWDVPKGMLAWHAWWGHASSSPQESRVQFLSLGLGVRVKVCRPKTNKILKPTECTTCIHLEAWGSSFLTPVFCTIMDPKMPHGRQGMVAPLWVLLMDSDKDICMRNPVPTHFGLDIWFCFTVHRNVDDVARLVEICLKLQNQCLMWKCCRQLYQIVLCSIGSSRIFLPVGSSSWY